jgi:hypothetical protein
MGMIIYSYRPNPDEDLLRGSEARMHELTEALQSAGHQPRSGQYRLGCLLWLARQFAGDPATGPIANGNILLTLEDRTKHPSEGLAYWNV